MPACRCCGCCGAAPRCWTAGEGSQGAGEGCRAGLRRRAGVDQERGLLAVLLLIVGGCPDLQEGRRGCRARRGERAGRLGCSRGWSPCCRCAPWPGSCCCCCCSPPEEGLLDPAWGTRPAGLAGFAAVRLTAARRERKRGGLLVEARPRGVVVAVECTQGEVGCHGRWSGCSTEEGNLPSAGCRRWREERVRLWVLGRRRLIRLRSRFRLTIGLYIGVLGYWVCG